MKLVVGGLAAMALALGLSGCATITRGTTEDLKVVSTPPGAKAATSNGFSCDATPCSMKMPRKTALDVTVSKAGYVSKTVHVDSVMAGTGAAGMAGDLVLGGIVGMAIDGTNGSTKDLKPNPVEVTLDPAN